MLSSLVTRKCLPVLDKPQLIDYLFKIKAISTSAFLWSDRHVPFYGFCLLVFIQTEHCILHFSLSKRTDHRYATLFESFLELLLHDADWPGPSVSRLVWLGAVLREGPADWVVIGASFDSVGLDFLPLRQRNRRFFSWFRSAVHVTSAPYFENGNGSGAHVKNLVMTPRARVLYGMELNSRKLQ